MVNEAVVHGFDAATAADRPADIDADIAAALISNHLAMLTAPTWAMQRPESAHAIRGTGQTLQWLATDTADDAGAWFVERRPDGATWRPGTQQADVTVTGSARSLLLTLTRRLTLTDREATTISVDGDTDPRPALARQHRPCQRLTVGRHRACGLRCSPSSWRSSRWRSSRWSAMRPVWLFPLSMDDAVPQVCRVVAFESADELQFDVAESGRLEQSPAVTQQYGHEVQFEFVELTSCQ